MGNTTEATESKEVAATNDEAADTTCDGLIRNHVYASVAVGLLPLPLIDIVALTGVQIDMVRKMADAYGVNFSREVTKATIVSIIGGSVPVLGAPTLASLIKLIPGVGSALGGVSRSIFSGASTYAIGKLFQQHFAAGGTMLDLDPSKMRRYFRDYFAEGEKVASEAKDAKAA